MGNRVQKTVNGTATRYVWNGSNIVYESGIQSVTYSYGMGLLAMTSGTDEYYYVSNGHGDITQLTNSSGTIAEDYAYDAFGNQKDAEHSIYNPFRYSGEYFDSETGFLYLRNRYYDSSIGRFITEDPVRDGLNWYVYCNNNPVGFVDPSGLFGTDSKLAYSPNFYNEDVKTLQNELAWQGYLNESDIDGYFGQKTLNAVNRYKGDHGLWNYGEYRGVVGATTWSHLGLKVDYEYKGKEYYISPSTNKNKTTPVFSGSIQFGTGLMVDFKLMGVGIELGGKRYYEFSPNSETTENMQFSLMGQITNNAQIGGSITGSIDATTKKHLQNTGFAGIKIGNYVFGWNDLPEDDLKISFEAEAYLGVGGGGNVSLNLSELWRRIFK